MEKFGIFRKPVVTICEEPAYKKQTPDGIRSTIADEGLLGMSCRVLDAAKGWAHILTHYGYEGWVETDTLMLLDEENCREWNRDLAAVEGVVCDVVSAPTVQGVLMEALPAGALVKRAPERDTDGGWCGVVLPDGREGYLPARHLAPVRFENDYLSMDAERVLEYAKRAGARDGRGGREDFSLQPLLDAYYGGSRERFLDAVAEEARKYLGVSYRWAGKSPLGIDCSGLTSMAYMRCGVLIYRDASLADGWPVVRADVPCDPLDLSRLEKGDLLYFPGHIAMYIGDGKYIHSTAYKESCGVVINSLRPSDADYREDLPKILKAVGRLQD